MKAFVGVDVGTTGVKASLFSLEGRLLGQALVPSTLHHPSPGLTEQDPKEMLEETLAAVRKAVDQAGPVSIQALALDGQMAGLMGIDQDWEATTHYDSWLDTRCGDQVAAMNRHQEEVIRFSGSAPGFFFGPKLLWWKEVEPEVYARTAKFIQPAAFIAGKLAGLNGDQAYMDQTYIHFTNLSDNKNETWAKELLDLFEVDGAKLPRIISPTEVIGVLARPWAEKTGLPSGLPIAAGCGDTAAGLLGAGLVIPGEAVDTAGTASVLTFCSDEFRPDDQSRTLLSCRSVIDGLWYSLAYINGGGLCIDWFARELGGEGGKGSLEELEQAAAELPVGSEGLTFCPHFAGRNFPYQPDLRGSWTGLTWNHKPVHLLRSILEGIALEYRHYLEAFKALYPDLETRGLRIIGGGASSDLFCRIKADCLGLKSATLEEREFGTLGSALVAAAAVGQVDDLAGLVQELTRERKVYQPRPREVEAYDQLFKEYRITIDGLIDIFRQRSGLAP